MIDEKELEPRRLLLNLHRIEATFSLRRKRGGKSSSSFAHHESTNSSSTVIENDDRNKNENNNTVAMKNEREIKVQERLMLLRKFVATQRSNDLGRLAELERTVQSIQGITKRQNMYTSDMSTELHTVKSQLMEMSRNMNELCNRLNRELAHVGDMAVRSIFCLGDSSFEREIVL